MEKHGYSLCQRFLAMLLCAVMLVPSILTPAFATEATEPAAVVETTAPAQEWTLPECNCGSTETELGKHGETCARKVFLEEFCEETAADIFAKWEKLPEECQKYILECLSKNEADAEKLAELNGYVNAAEEGSEDPTKETEDPTKETEDPTKETEDPTKETEDPTKETENPTKETEGATKETEGATEEDEESADETEATEETEPEDATFTINRNGETPLAVIYAASDFQNKDKNNNDDFAKGQEVMSTIMEKTGCKTVTGAMFLGDYTAIYTKEATSAGLGHVKSVLNEKWKLNDSQVIYVQGNHDQAVAGLDPFGAQEFEHYNVFVIPEDNYPWQQNTTDKENIVKATAASLEAFLKDKVEKKDGRPVFVASHIPLHYTRRSSSSGAYDNLYAKYIFDVLNKYGDQLNIIFVFGHNHSSNYDNYIGGAAIYLPVGSDILIPKTTKDGYTTNELKFTYMNGGYIGYCNCVCQTAQSSTIFKIYENEVLVSRYDKNGKANLKDKGISVDSLPADESVPADAAIARKEFSVDLDYGNLATNQMAVDSTGKLTVEGLYGVNYIVDWVSDNESVVTVSPSADTMTATLTAHATGSAKITATITEVSKTKAVGDVITRDFTVEVIETTASNPVVFLKPGTYPYFRKVDTMEAGQTYALIDMEHDGYVVGQQMALQYSARGDYTENDDVGTYTASTAASNNEFSAAPVDVIQLPVGGELVTLADISSTDCWFTAETSTNGLKIKTNGGGYLYVSENAGDDYRYDRDQDRIRRKSSDGSEWTYSAANGLLSSRIGTWSKYGLYYSQANSDFSVYRYDHKHYPEGTVQRQPEQVNSRAYAFRKTDIQIDTLLTAQLSDTTGYVNKDVGYTNAAGKRLGGAQTGDMIVISDGTGTYEIPVTIDMLSGSFDVTDPGTYTGLTVTYAGKTICENYVLVVRNSATILKNDAAREYLDTIYTLTDTMIPGRQYLVVDTDEAGIAHAMGVSKKNVFAYNVQVQELPVDGGSRLYIDSSRYSWNTSSTTGADITKADLIGRGITDQGAINALQTANATTYGDLRTQYLYATRLVWSPTQLLYYYTESADTKYTAAQDDYYFLLSQMQTALHDQQRILSIRADAEDNQLDLLSYPRSTDAGAQIWWNHWKYDASNGGLRMKESQVSHAYLFYNFQNMVKSNSMTDEQKKASLANQNFQTEDYGNETYPNLKHLRRTWIYERVTDIDTVSARISDRSGSIVQRTENSKATTGSAFTGDYILVDTTHADGTVTTRQVPITVSMLSGTLDMETAGSYNGLTVTYQGVTICEGYTLDVRAFVADDYPEFPDEGAVRIDKQLDTSKYNYKSTGAASIDLSLSGIPAQTGTDLVIILDLSSSMRDCIHGKDAGQTCVTCGTVDTTNSRMAVMEETLEEMIRTIQQPINGYIPDVDIAIAAFNGYTPINTDWEFPYGTYTHEQNQLVNQGNVDASRILQSFISIADLDPEVLNRVENEAETQINSGTNYDRAMELAYDLMEAKQRQNALNNVSRDPIVIFMSDGCPFQYNYFCGSSVQQTWNDYLAGTLKSTDAVITGLDDTVETIFNLYYNADSNKHWMAEAIKGDPNATYKVIDPDAMTENHITQVRGLGAELYSIGFGLGGDNQIEDVTVKATMKHMASDEAHYIEVNENDELESAFSYIANHVRNAGDAVFTDQMGPEFDLITSNTITWTLEENDGTEVTKTLTFDPAPTIVVKRYELYKRSEIGDTLEFQNEDGTTTSVKVTEQMVGARKPVEPHTIEIVTFNDDGTAAYSTMDVDGDGFTGNSDNILENEGKVIHAATFWYNTDTTGAQMIDVDGDGTAETSLEKECFYWNVGDIPQEELMLSYNVYLTGSMEGTRDAGTYDTNTHAELNYTNYLDNPCKLSVPTPKLPWGQGTVGYAFYLVDEYGNPIINQTTGELGSFERSVEITQPVYTDFLLNSEGEIEEGQAVARDVLPEGYALFDPDAVYTVTLASDGTGTYEIVKGENASCATTYIQGLSPTDVNPVGLHTTENFATANTIVWFAVYAVVQAVPDTVVVDFGLPVDIDVIANENMMGTSVTLEHIARADLTAIKDGYDAAKANNSELKLWEYLHGLGKKDSERPFTTTSANGDFGTIAINTETVDGITKSTGEVRYTLNTSNGMQVKEEETFVYAVKYTGSVGTQGYYYSTVTVIPATSIYYEDSFVTFSTWQVSDDIELPNQWKPVGTTADKTQGEDRPGSFSLPAVDANNIYGYDGAYTDMTTYSLGSAMKFTANKQVYGEAQFTFWGTGFDVISLTGNTTGTITVDVYDANAFEKDGYFAEDCQTFVVDTYYGYKYENGQWVVDKEADGDLYQIPVMKVTGLEHKKYTAVITVYYSSVFDHQKHGAYDFYLDAIRIYDPANDGKDNPVIEDAYKKDGEGWPEYFELRNLIIKKNDFDSLKGGTGEGIVFIDNTLDANNKVTYSIKDYTNFGPNNELYLAPGQSVAFNLNVTGDVAGIHLAMKTINGSGKAAKVKVFAANSATSLIDKTIATATDLYYDITTLNGKTVVISNSTDSTAILSITNVKVTYQSEHTDGIEDSLFTVSADMAEAAIYALGRMSAPDPEDEVPETTAPVPSEPEVTEPEATEPKVTEPSRPTVPSGPEVTEPSQSTEPAEPEVTEPSQPTEPFEPEGTQPEVEVDIGNLEKAITKAKSLKKADYTIESWNAMEAVLKVAEKVMADQGATQDEIDDAADALDKAIKALALPAGKNSETGNNTFVVIVAVIGAAALAGIVVLLVYKQKNRR